MDQVLIVGAADHPEVRAICGWCEHPVVVKDVTELRARVEDGTIDCAKPLTMVIQTTQTAANLKECQNFLKKICTNAKIFDTICGATFTRQTEAEKLATFCDAMVVIGGRHSANSKHLYEICAQHCANVQFIEKAAQLDTSAFNHAENIGLTAGASVPAWIIKEVKQKMSDEILNEVTEEAETPTVETPAAEAEEHLRDDYLVLAESKRHCRKPLGIVMRLFLEQTWFSGTRDAGAGCGYTGCCGSRQHILEELSPVHN